jgi:hypothetical protein
VRAPVPLCREASRHLFSPPAGRHVLGLARILQVLEGELPERIRRRLFAQTSLHEAVADGGGQMHLDGRCRGWSARSQCPSRGESWAARSFAKFSTSASANDAPSSALRCWYRCWSVEGGELGLHGGDGPAAAAAVLEAETGVPSLDIKPHESPPFSTTLPRVPRSSTVCLGPWNARASAVAFVGRPAHCPVTGATGWCCRSISH